jgi:glycosyltransferase involved in cell wall biosynthesis
MRAHNVEHIIWERLYSSEKNRLRKWYLKLLAKRLKQYEIQHLNNLDAILPITPDDETIFKNLGCSIPLHVTPLGIDLDDYVPSPEKISAPSLFHLGSMDWLPNLEAIDWFLENCWARIHAERPQLKLYLAGRGFPKRLVDARHPNVVCEGEISDSNEYMRTKQVMVVPLLSGSGMRVKIIQGMALGKTIISTSIGAEGIQYTNGKNILIANTPEEFAAAVARCMNDEVFTISVGKAARQLITGQYSNEAIGKSVSGFYRELTGE